MSKSTAIVKAFQKRMEPGAVPTHFIFKKIGEKRCQVAVSEGSRSTSRRLSPATAEIDIDLAAKRILVNGKTVGAYLLCGETRKASSKSRQRSSGRRGSSRQPNRERVLVYRMVRNKAEAAKPKGAPTEFSRIRQVGGFLGRSAGWLAWAIKESLTTIYYLLFEVWPLGLFFAGISINLLHQTFPNNPKIAIARRFVEEGSVRIFCLVNQPTIVVRWIDELLQASTGVSLMKYTSFLKGTPGLIMDTGRYQLMTTVT